MLSLLPFPEVAYIRKQQDIMEEVAAQNISSIKDQMHLARERCVRDWEWVGCVRDWERVSCVSG